MLGSEDVKKYEVPVEINTQTDNKETPQQTEVVIPIETAKFKIAEMFNIPHNEIARYDVDLNRIIEYVNSLNPQNLDDIIYHVKSLGNTLGKSALEKQIKTISRYIFLVQQRDILNRDIERIINDK